MYYKELSDDNSDLQSKGDTFDVFNVNSVVLMYSSIISEIREIWNSFFLYCLTFVVILVMKETVLKFNKSVGARHALGKTTKDPKLF